MSDTIQDIECKYPVESITANGEQLWPLLRIYIGAKLTADMDAKTINKSVLMLLLKSLFYGFFNIFNRYDYLMFSSTDQRKNNDGDFIDKSVGKIAELLDKSLIIEHPVIGHIPRSKLNKKNVSSKSFFFLLMKVYSFFLKDVKIDNEVILKQILNDYAIQIDYHQLVKRNQAQYKAAKLLYKWFKPKAVFIVCYYTHTGLIKAFKEKNVKIIEIQHGLINKSHVAYTVSREIDTSCFPDYLLTYGKNELNIFDNNNYFIDSNCVIPIGHQYLDFLSNTNIVDQAFQKLIDGYEKVVSITGQNHYIEPKLLDFITKAANLNPKIIYVYVPRHVTNDYSHYKFPKNIVFANWLNCYEIILQSHIHSTVFSTCAVESLTLGIPNILIDIEGLSSKYLTPLIGDNNANLYVNTPNKFVELIESFNFPAKEEIIKMNSANIMPDYNKNLIETLKKIVSLN